ncbi:GGDEF domain-containing protein [Devosia sp. SL43]|uniref:GGDEF domain-containing protein n=1 Tax=Devosia sp. SL43 TaxID=2806348 RepID=UPI001F35C2E2|nr:GGDEF domain-containing protein [Devosia sp. SL43]UJW85628.1 GGDEF domain-containing protein [Devosia sp. SL43]
MSNPELTIAEAFAHATQLLRAGRCDEALAEFRGIYVQSELAGDSLGMAACLCEMAWSCYRLGDLEQGLECAMGARWLWKRLDNLVELARAMAVEAILFLDLGFSDEAYELATEALDIAEQAGDEAVLAFALNAKGIVLTICREAEMGAGLVGRAVAIAEQLSNHAAAAYYLLNLGFCHAKLAEEADALSDADLAMGEREAAIELTDIAITKADAVGDYWTLRAALGNCAEMLALEGRYDIALQYLERSASLPAPPGPSLRIHFLYTLGDVQFRAGRFADARASAVEALRLADLGGQIDHQVNASGKLAEILEALGDVEGALSLHKRFHALYVRQSGETARRRARVEEIRTETDRLRSRAATLADQAHSDPLTGIANRRSFDQILNRLAGTPFAVAIVDLDHFKSVNDRFSHITGDAVLQRVASILVGQLGPHGHAARLGGEEFALIFPNAPEAVAASFCEGVRTAISATSWSDLAPGLAVTVSIGLAAGNGESPSGALMQVADNRLYMAKSSGRDCVVAHDKLVAMPTAVIEERQRWRA